MKSLLRKNNCLNDSTHSPFFSKERGNNFFGKSDKQKPFFNSHTIQPKLTIGQPNDIYEKEADATADKVVQRSSDSSFSNGENNSKPFFTKSIIPMQRKCAGCEQEEKLQKKSYSSSQTASPNIESSLSSSKGSGSPLSNNTCEQMESSFGADFSNVRIHNDSSAIQMNKDLNAQAFTHGSDIYFNSGKYDSNSNSGKHLLAHELTHVVQQGAIQTHLQREVAVSNTTVPLTSSVPSPVTTRVCGPDVSAPVSGVWSRIQSEFRGWSPTDKLAASIYLIAPYVPTAGSNPRAGSGSALFEGSLAEPFIAIISALSNDPILAAYIGMMNAQWQLNRDAFDTIGLFVNSANWTLHVPGCAQPSCSGLTPPPEGGLPRGFTDPCESPNLCSFSVQMGTNCWLSGTVNYGTYGIMMKEAYSWCEAQRNRMLGLLPGILLRSFGDPAVTVRLLKATMTNEEIAAAFLKELFSLSSLIVYVGGYKLWDMENPIQALNWAITTYMRGATSIAAGRNRPLCQPTCGPLDPSIFSGWNYVWEPVQHRP